MAIYLGDTKLTGTGVQVDDALSASSTNPVENKAFAAPLIYTVKQVQKDVLKEMNEQEVVDASELVSSTSMINPVALDLSPNTQLKKLTCSGTSTTPLTGLSSVTVSNVAPLDSTTSPQIDVSYSSLNRTGLVSMFNSMPYNVGYEVVGSPTITDGVASGFSKANYARLEKEFQLNVSTNWEMVWCVKRGSAGNSIFACDSTGQFALITLGTTMFQLRIKPTSDVSFQNLNVLVPSGTVDPDTFYYLKVRRDNGMLYGSSSEDGNSYGTEVTMDISSFANLRYIQTIGVATYQSQDGFGGAIDFNKSYIKVNGVPWFTGKAAMTKTCSVVGCTGTADLTADDKAIATGKGWELTVA